MMRVIRLLLWVLVALAAVAGTILYLNRPRQPQPGGEMVMSSIGGPFTLVGADGQPFSSARLNGRPYAIFFGFTHCPDVCPTTLARLSNLRKRATDDPDALPILFVSVDPERDGPAEVGRYAELFGDHVVGLTGSPAQIEQVKKQFAVYSRKAPAEGGDYSVDHTATVFLMDGQGRLASTISPAEDPEVALQKMRNLLS